MRKDKSWLVISILVILMALIWLGISAFQVLRKTTVPADVTVAVTPLRPEINQQILPILNKRAPK